MAITVVERFKKDSMYGLSPPGQKNWPLWRGGRWRRFDCRFSLQGISLISMGQQPEILVAKRTADRENLSNQNWSCRAC